MMEEGELLPDVEEGTKVRVTQEVLPAGISLAAVKGVCGLIFTFG